MCGKKPLHFLTPVNRNDLLLQLDDQQWFYFPVKSSLSLTQVRCAAAVHHPSALRAFYNGVDFGSSKGILFGLLLMKFRVHHHHLCKLQGSRLFSALGFQPAFILQKCKCFFLCWSWTAPRHSVLAVCRTPPLWTNSLLGLLSSSQWSLSTEETWKPTKERGKKVWQQNTGSAMLSQSCSENRNQHHSVFWILVSLHMKSSSVLQ